tara:strand:+ start:143 stop:286 length:144 start_codon:yes stop_codon:yes gene_type:complete
MKNTKATKKTTRKQTSKAKKAKTEVTSSMLAKHINKAIGRNWFYGVE